MPEIPNPMVFVSTPHLHLPTSASWNWMLLESLQILQENLTVSHQFILYHKSQGTPQKKTCFMVHSITWRYNFRDCFNTCCYITILSISWHGPSLRQCTWIMGLCNNSSWEYADTSYTTLSIHTRAQRLVCMVRKYKFYSMAYHEESVASLLHHTIENTLANTIYPVHDGNAGDTKVHLYSDWLYFLWYGLRWLRTLSITFQGLDFDV